MAAIKKLIQTIQLTANQTSIQFTNIPQNGTDLLIVASLRDSGGQNGATGVHLSFNGSTSGYSEKVFFQANGTQLSSASNSGNTALVWALMANGGGTLASTFGNCVAYISNYSSSVQKNIGSESLTENNSANVTQFVNSALWANTAGIESLVVAQPDGVQFVTGSSVSLYTITKGTSNGVTVS